MNKVQVVVFTNAGIFAHGQGRDQVSQKLAVGEAQKMGGMIGCLVEDV